MATHKIFIGNYSVTKQKVGNARSVEYSYDYNKYILEIFWRDECVFSKESVMPGDAFYVQCDGDKPIVDSLHLPEHPSDLLMFILGFGKGKRSHNKRTFKAALGRERLAQAGDDRVEYYFNGRHYDFRYYKDPKGKIYHLSAFIACALSRDEYLEILSEWPYEIRYPRVFLRKIFTTNFKLSDKDVNTIFKAWDD